MSLPNIQRVLKDQSIACNGLSGRRVKRLNDYNPERMQTIGGGGLSHCGGLQTCGAGEIDPAWASLDVALVVGTATIGFVPGNVARITVTGPV